MLSRISNYFKKKDPLEYDENDENENPDDHTSKLELKFFSYLTMWYMVRISNKPRQLSDNIVLFINYICVLDEYTCYIINH